jgi:hypothetical protein
MLVTPAGPLIVFIFQVQLKAPINNRHYVAEAIVFGFLITNKD